MGHKIIFETVPCSGCEGKWADRCALCLGRGTAPRQKIIEDPEYPGCDVCYGNVIMWNGQKCPYCSKSETEKAPG